MTATQHKASAKTAKAKSRKRAGQAMEKVSVCLRKDGRTVVSVELPKQPTGERNRIQRSFRTPEAAEAYIENLDIEQLARVPADLRNIDVGGWMEKYVEELPRGEYSTEVDRGWIKAIIVKGLGSIKLATLSPSDIRGLLRALRDDEQKSKGTCDKVLHMLRAALRQAVDDGLLKVNPAENVKPVRAKGKAKVRQPEWSEQQVKAILEAGRDSKIPVLLPLALLTGARIGELIGLRMQDYDPVTGVLSINGTAKRHGGRGKGKTEAAHRQLTLPKAVRRALDQHLAAVEQQKLKMGSQWGQRKKGSEEGREKQRQRARARWNSGLREGWVPPPPLTEPYEPLFPSSRGTPLNANNVRTEWRRIMAACAARDESFPQGCSFHQTRAHFITKALHSGLDNLKAVQDIVGHASPVMTLRYVLPNPERQKQLLEKTAKIQGWEDPEDPITPDDT